jgi:site-specific recombinase XerD
MKSKMKGFLFPQPYSNGEYPVYIRIYYNAKTSYISAGFSIPSRAWNEDNSEAWESMPTLTKKLQESLSNDEIQAFKEKQKSIILLPNAFKINSEIRAIISKLEEIQKRLEVEKKEISSNILKSLYENKDKAENARKDFFQYFQEVANSKFQDKQIRTSEKYSAVLRKLKAFRKDKPLPIEELTSGFLKDFSKYLAKQGAHPNYIHINLKNLKTVIQKEAIKTDKIISPEKNPFLNFEMPKIIESGKEKLDISEITRIEKINLDESDILFHIRNAFLFSLYNAGIRIGDLLQLKFANIKEGRLIYSMGKTAKIRSIKIFPQALKILKYYESKKEKDSDFIFPFLDNKAEYSKLISPEDFQKASPEMLSFLFGKVESRIAVFNAGLKVIAVRAQIKKKISSHVARHSFADMARKKNISVYDIMQMLGHSNISITQSYLNKLDLDSQDSAMKSVFN